MSCPASSTGHFRPLAPACGDGPPCRPWARSGHNSPATETWPSGVCGPPGTLRSRLLGSGRGRAEGAEALCAGTCGMAPSLASLFSCLWTKAHPWKNADACSCLLGSGIRGNFQLKPRELGRPCSGWESREPLGVSPPQASLLLQSEDGAGVSPVCAASRRLEPKRSPHVWKSQTVLRLSRGNSFWPVETRSLQRSPGSGGPCRSAGLAAPGAPPLRLRFAAGGTLSTEDIPWSLQRDGARAGRRDAGVRRNQQGRGRRGPDSVRQPLARLPAAAIAPRVRESASPESRDFDELRIRRLWCLDGVLLCAYPPARRLPADSDLEICVCARESGRRGRGQAPGALASSSAHSEVALWALESRSAPDPDVPACGTRVLSARLRLCPPLLPPALPPKKSCEAQILLGLFANKQAEVHTFG